MNNKDFLVIGTRHGKGVVAGKNFREGDELMIFHGPIVHGSEIPDNYSEIEDHYVQIGDDLYMGPSHDIDDLVNHSCDPNSGLVVPESGSPIILKAIRDIKKGDEITWDYSTTMDDGWIMECDCGSRVCRHEISDFKKLPEVIRDQYINMEIVAPYLLGEK